MLSASAIMAAGTVLSRLTGFVRAGLLAAAIGLAMHAEAFNVANTIPNSLYILIAGGVFNTVLVPQLVRAIKNDPDGGDAYANRIIGLGIARTRQRHDAPGDLRPAAAASCSSAANGSHPSSPPSASR